MTSAVDAGAGPMTPVELREHIQGFGLTQTELAQLLGANPRTVRRWLEEDGAGEGAGVPGAVAATLRAWQRLQHAALAWRPQDAPLTGADGGTAVAAQRFYTLGIDAMLERVRMRGGPAIPWDVDLARQRATVGAVQLSFYVLEGGGFVPLSYRRQDACIARTLERNGQRATPALRLGPAAVVGGTTLVLWEQRPAPTVTVILPLGVARAVLGPLASVRELREIVDRNGTALSRLAQALVDEGAGTVNALGVRELRFDEALLRIARPRTLALGSSGEGAAGQGSIGQGGEGAGAGAGALAVGRET